MFVVFLKDLGREFVEGIVWYRLYYIDCIEVKSFYRKVF